jgi:L-fuconolactonase
MVGSDWPECTLAASYEEVLGLVLDYTAELSQGEQANVWESNAVRIYNL